MRPARVGWSKVQCALDVALTWSSTFTLSLWSLILNLGSTEPSESLNAFDSSGRMSSIDLLKFLGGTSGPMHQTPGVTWPSY